MLLINVFSEGGFPWQFDSSYFIQVCIVSASVNHSDQLETQSSAYHGEETWWRRDFPPSSSYFKLSHTASAGREAHALLVTLAATLFTTFIKLTRHRWLGRQFPFPKPRLSPRAKHPFELRNSAYAACVICSSPWQAPLSTLWQPLWGLSWDWAMQPSSDMWLWKQSQPYVIKHM